MMKKLKVTSDSELVYQRAWNSREVNAVIFESRFKTVAPPPPARHPSKSSQEGVKRRDLEEGDIW